MTEWGRGGRWAGPSHEVLIVTYVAWAAAAGVNLVAVCVVWKWLVRFLSLFLSLLVSS